MSVKINYVGDVANWCVITEDQQNLDRFTFLTLAAEERTCVLRLDWVPAISAYLRGMIKKHDRTDYVENRIHEAAMLEEMIRSIISNDLLITKRGDSSINRFTKSYPRVYADELNQTATQECRKGITAQLHRSILLNYQDELVEGRYDLDLPIGKERYELSYYFLNSYRSRSGYLTVPVSVWITECVLINCVYPYILGYLDVDQSPTEGTT